MRSIDRETPFVSIILLNFNGKSCLEKCLSSVLRTNYPNFEVILVDNASTDNSLTLAEQSFEGDKRLRFVKNSENLGFSGGNNVGFKHAKGEFVVFLNNDTIVDHHWLDPLVNAMKEDHSLGLAQSTLLEIDGEKIQTAGWLFSDYLIFQPSIGEGKSTDTKFPSVFEVSFACGASMITRRELLDEIGLFDPQIPFFYDDTLLSLKTWLSGKRVVTISKSKVFHIGEATRSWNAYFRTFHLLKAKICLIFDVYFNLSDLVKTLFILAIFLSTELVFLMKSKKVSVMSSNIWAIGWVLRNLKHIWKNRLEHWSKAKITPKMLVEKFIRIKLPTSLYLMPYRLRSIHLQNQLKKYENMLTQISIDKKEG